MPTRAIDELIWTALTDSSFCEQLLGGRRRDLLETFRLTEAERQAVLAVKANTLESLAATLCSAPA